MTSKRGKIVVIEGNDGAGKETQSKLLVKRLKERGITAKVISFPLYENESSYFIKEYLNGGYGDMSRLTAKQTANLYAIDRFDWWLKNEKEINKGLDNGIWYIFDRYVYSNIIYMAAKEVMEFLNKNHLTIESVENLLLGDFYCGESWKKKLLDDIQNIIDKMAKYVSKLEFATYGLPKPDIKLYLSISYEASKKLREGRSNKIDNSDTKDLHESDDTYLKLVNMISDSIFSSSSFYLERFERINCAKSDYETHKVSMLEKEEISNIIIDICTSKKYASMPSCNKSGLDSYRNNHGFYFGKLINVSKKIKKFKKSDTINTSIQNSEMNRNGRYYPIQQSNPYPYVSYSKRYGNSNFLPPYTSL